ncbi:TPA: helix-turn-helix transcriptional regulator [Streptococcus agalactiae]
MTLFLDSLLKELIIVNRLREYRIKASISQLALAKSVGVARQTINLIENNKYNPSLDLCIRLQTDLNTLFWDSRHL